jgi:Rrf2 family protein
MLTRRSSQLALQASLLLALEPAGQSRRVREIAAGLGVPATYLAKVLQGLTRAGLLRAARGPGGGVQLARPANDIRLWDVLAAVEPVGEFERCFLGLGDCDDTRPCPLHESWGPIRARLLEMLQARSLGEFAVEAASQGLLEPDKKPGDRLRRRGGGKR